MRAAKHLRQRLTALSLLGVVLLTFPVLSLPEGQWFGLPAQFVYLFVVWALLIGMAALNIERGGD